jgi:hypothetical protein
MAEPSRRLFSIAEANAALPALAARLARLRELRDRIVRERERLDVLWQRLDAGEAVLADLGARQQALEALAAEFGASIAELQATGVVVRDLETGLVDFPAEVRGIPIFLCWRMGEPGVGFWHGVTEGFAGRRPIAAIQEATASGPD